MGIVESQETQSVEKDSSKTVKEVYVSEGDMVSEGDELFIYDTEDMEMQLQQLQLELQSIQNNITSYNDQIKDLTTQRQQASADDKLGFTSQIQNIQAMEKEEEYNLSVKQLEIDRQKQSIESAVVTAPMSGIVKKINNDSGSGDSYDSSDSSSGFITIMAVGDYRIKGTASELTIYNFYSGMPVIVRSRVDESIVWSGVVDSIDLEPQQDDNNYYYYDSSSGESTSKYAFYVTLDSIDGLMLGQHVYIEMDNGQTEVKEGLWLPSYYIVTEDDGSYVWARDSKERIEKRKLTLGEYDENTDCYQVLDGLTEEDYIAFPEDDIVEGAETTTNYDDVLDQIDWDSYDLDEDFDMDDSLYDDSMDDDFMYDDSMYDDSMDDDSVYDDSMDDDSVYDDSMDEEGTLGEDGIMTEDDAAGSDTSNGGE
jgi:HlyD family secretion protein